MINSKLYCVVAACPESLSGYGLMSRDIIRHLIELDIYEIEVISQQWGGTPLTGLIPERDSEIIKRILPQPIQLKRQPDIFINISVPNEMQKVGKYNISITAGIESNVISLPWIQGCNRADVVFTISEHSKKGIVETVAEERNAQGQVMNRHQVNVPVEVLPNCVDNNIFKKISSNEIPESINKVMTQVKEKFAFLTTGIWLQNDRKNIGLTIKVFCESFKHLPSATRPALVLKTSGATFSVMDREDCLKKIAQIRASVGAGCPNVYLLHGELSDSEMNGLFNHSKIKCLVSLHSGEGFGKSLLEFSVLGNKPIIATAWSGPLDFLNAQDAILINGEVKEIPPQAVWTDVLVMGAKWMWPDANQASQAMFNVFKNYDSYAIGAKRLAKENAEKFSYENIKTRLAELLKQYVPPMTASVPTPVVLPKLKKLTAPTVLPSIIKPTEDVTT